MSDRYPGLVLIDRRKRERYPASGWAYRLVERAVWAGPTRTHHGWVAVYENGPHKGARTRLHDPRVQSLIPAPIPAIDDVLVPTYPPTRRPSRRPMRPTTPSDRSHLYHGLLLTEGDLVRLEDAEDVVQARVTHRNGYLYVGPVMLVEARREGRYKATIIERRKPPVKPLPTADGLYVFNTSAIRANASSAVVYRLRSGNWREETGFESRDVTEDRIRDVLGTRYSLVRLEVTA